MGGLPLPVVGWVERRDGCSKMGGSEGGGSLGQKVAEPRGSLFPLHLSSREERPILEIPSFALRDFSHQEAATVAMWNRIVGVHPGSTLPPPGLPLSREGPQC